MRKYLLPGPAALVALLVGLKLGTTPLRDNDSFFHMAGGRWVLEHGFSRVDPFSVTGTAGWVPHEWGFGVLCALIAKAFGAAGPVLFVGALVAANVLLLWAALGRAMPRRGVPVVLALLAVLGVQASTWHEVRPYHLAHLLFAGAVLAVQSWREGNNRVLWLFPPLVALWANLHGSWALGPALLGATAVGTAMDAPGERRRAGIAVLASLGAFLAAALTPSGFHIYLYPLQHSMLKSTHNLIEWAPLDLNDRWAWVYLGLFGAMLYCMGAATQRRAAVLLPTLGLAIVSLKVQRHATFAAVMLGLALLEHAQSAQLVRGLEPLRRRLASVNDAFSRWTANAGGAVWPALLLGMMAFTQHQQPVPMEKGVLPQVIPLPCLQQLKALPPGRVLNNFITGGMVSFFAGPEYKVYIDGRNDPFPQPIHDGYMHLLWGEPGWEEALASYDPDYLLWPLENPGNILLDQLRQRGGWREAVRDTTSGYVLWVRERSGGAAVGATGTP